MNQASVGEEVRQRNWLQWSGVVLFLLWLFYCLTAYYVVHKPFDSQLMAEIGERSGSGLHALSLTAIVRTLLDMLVALWLAWIALGVGAQLLVFLSVESESDLAAALYRLGLGFGCLGLLTLMLGLVGLLQTAVFYIVAILLTALGTRAGWNLVRRLRLPHPPRLVALYLVLALGLALTLALLPPTSWDGLFYHLTGPKLYLEAGRIQPGIDIPHLSFPSLAEMLFMMAMGLRGEISAKLLHYLFNLMLAGLVYVLARDHFKVKNSWTAVLFFYATPMVLSLAAWAYNDLALAFYQAAAVLAVLQWRREKQPHVLRLSGILCGLAMGLKYTSFVAPLFLVGVVIWDKRRRLADATRPLLSLMVPAALSAAPWYIKNLVFTGNPIYPFLFGGRLWDDFRSIAYAGANTGIGFDPVALLRLPHDLTLGLGDASQDGPTGPFFLAFLPLVFYYGFKRKKHSPPAFALLVTFAMVQYLFWTAGVIYSGGLWQSRLLLTAFVTLCPALAWMLEDLKRLDHPQFSLQRFLHLVIGLVLALGLIAQSLAWLSKNPLPHLIGQETNSELLRRRMGLHYIVMEEMNKLLPQGSVVALLWEPRSYYCDIDCRPDSILDTYAHLEHLHADAASITAAWKGQGVTHVLFHEAGLQFVLSAEMSWVAPRDLTTLQQIRERYLVPIATWQSVYTLYRLET